MQRRRDAKKNRSKRHKEQPEGTGDETLVNVLQTSVRPFVWPGLLCVALTVGMACKPRFAASAAQSAPAQSRPANSKQPEASVSRRVDYEITPVAAGADGSPRMLHVAVTFPAGIYDNPGSLPTQMISLQMPVWSPGDYHVQNFGKYVQNLKAIYGLDAPQNASQTRPVTHPDADTWLVYIGFKPSQPAHITVSYDLPQTPPGYFSENVELRDHYAFVNGASALLYLTAHKELPTTLTAHLPDDWKAETPLPSVAIPNPQFPGYPPPPPIKATDMRFAAPDYDTLADSPLVMADKTALQTFDLTADKATPTLYRAVYFGGVEPPADAAAQNDVLMRLARAENRIMGGAPTPRYDFFFEINGRGGGLEHLNACRIPVYPGINPQRFAPFVAHEFFHQWNVKRIRPAVLGPFDYVHPPRTRNLWFAEGVTEYYAHVATRRAGLYTPDQFLAHWRRQIARIQRNPARLKITADQASLDVWEAGGSQGSGGLSYYDKGELIGLCLDLKIRHVTQNRKSLDDVMRALFKQGAPPRPGYGEDELRDTVNTVSGQNLTEFYNLLARSTQEMPFAECLTYAGLDANLMPLPQPTVEQTALLTQWTVGDD